MAKAEEDSSNYKIASKKSTVLLKDLKSQLHKETDKNATLKASVDELREVSVNSASLESTLAKVF